MNSNWQKDILEFHLACGHYVGKKPEIPSASVMKLRYNLVEEEMEETLDAIVTDDLEKIADGIADSIVVLLGTAVSYGIDMQPIWDEVHETNMAKTGSRKREDGKSLKPEGWQPPDIKRLLRKQGGKL